MRVHTFVLRCNFDGEPLLFLTTSTPNFEPTAALGAAHDIMEHNVRTEKGTLHEEIKAFGAMLWVRGDGQYWHSPQHACQNLYSELENFLLNSVEDMLALPEPPKYREIRDADSVYPCAESVIREIETRFAHESTAVTLRAVAFDMSISDEDLLDVRRKIRGWMRVGFLEARRRYKRRGLCVYETARLFERLRKELHAALTTMSKNKDSFTVEDHPRRAYPEELRTDRVRVRINYQKRLLYVDTRVGGVRYD